jgi:alginate O-acetyltransferase complex protein AlgJ
MDDVSQQRPDTLPERHKLARAVFRVAGLVFFFLPVALLALGARAKPIENRPLAAAPHWALSWHLLPQLESYLNEHLPLRDAAVRANAQLALGVFGEAPANTGNQAAATDVVAPVAEPGRTGAGEVPGNGGPPAQSPASGDATAPPNPGGQVNGNAAVTVGKGGWLYLTDDFLNECKPQVPPASVVAGLKRLNAMLTKAGKTFVFTVIPDKSVMVPQNLPASYPDKTCAAAGDQQIQSLLAASRNPAYLDMRTFLAAHQQADGQPYYLRKDTHFNGLGTTSLALQIVNRLAPALTADISMIHAPGKYTGDLTYMLGAPQSDVAPQAAINRPGVGVGGLTHVTLPSGLPVDRVRIAINGGQVAAGKTLLIGDSYSREVHPQLAPFFGDLTRIDLDALSTRPKAAISEIAAANVVVIVWVERDFALKQPNWPWSQSFLNRLQAALPTH